MADSPSLIFVTGGVRSGKSRFAEKLATEIAMKTRGQLNYLATGVPSDCEMFARIEKHRRERETGKHHWKTMEKSVQIEELTLAVNNHDIILLDCVTTLLNNELFSGGDVRDETFLSKVKEKIMKGIMAIKNRASTMIVVSNEVLNEPLAGNELVFTYGKLLGQIHQQLVQEADKVFLIEVGIPILMKGAK